MRRRAGGVTLVELVVTVVVLGVAMPPMLSALRSAHASRVTPVMASRARWLATEKLEDILADRHSAARGYGYVAAVNYPSEGAVDGFGAFARVVTVEETGPDLSGAGAGYKKVTVTVSWRDAALSGQVRSLSVGAVITDY